MKQKSPKAPSTAPSKKRKTSSKKTPKGLGDSIEKFTEKTGIKKLAEAIVGEDCGCSERKETLNRLFPYAQPMTPEDQKLYEDNLKGIKNNITRQQQDILRGIYKNVFNKALRPSSCGSCVSANLKKLKKSYEAVCDE